MVKIHGELMWYEKFLPTVYYNYRNYTNLAP